MRITFYFVLMACLHASATGFSQGEKVSIVAQQETVRQVFSEIQKKSEYRFFYRDDLAGLDKVINLEYKNTAIEIVLTDISRQSGLSYKIMENNLIVIQEPSKNQKRTINGKITSGDFPEGLPGVNVTIKNTSIGTISNVNGEYSIEVETDDAILVFSSIGYSTQEIAALDKTLIDVQLIENIESLNEVVVTALSIERDKNSLGYSVTQVDSEALTQVKLNNAINSLAGRVAGLQISSTPSGVDGSTRVVLRGVSSLSGSNRPLLVVDGIPVDGNSYGGASVGGGKDMGDALSDINRNDVESMTVLKGAGAAAVYGSRGANGVILITTKSGAKKQGTGISFNSSYLVDQPFVFPKLQSSYGQGAFGDYPNTMVGIEEPWIWSWGPKMEGQTETNWLGQPEPLTAQPNPFPSFYENGHSAINTISFDGGNASSFFRASVTNQNSQGIIPTNKITKQTVNLRGTSKFGKAITMDGKLTYIHSSANDRPYLAEDNANAGWAMSILPRNVHLQQLEDNTVNSLGIEQWAWDKTLGNPYWARANKRNQDEKNRIQSLLSFKAIINDHLDLFVRSGFDYTSRDAKEYAAAGSAVNANYRGWMNQSFGDDLEWNSDFLVNYSGKILEMIDFTLSAGGNYRYNNSKGINQSGSGWRVPDFYNINNLETYNTDEWFSEKEVVSLYSLANFSYSNYLYADFSYRSDWSSTLPIGQNQYPFYSANGSLLFTEAFHIKSKTLTNGQLRGSYAVAGNDTGPYQTKNYYSVDQTAIPYPTGSMNNQLAFPNFKPEIKTTWEVGTNLQFLDNRINLDVAYYSAVTENQIMDVKLAPSSGFNNIRQNAGEIKNSGLEVLISGTPVETASGFIWDASLNLTKNKSVVVSLADDQNRIVLQNSILDLATVEMRPGDPFGSIYGIDFVRDADGNKIIGDNGYPLVPGIDQYKRLGDINPDLTGGFSNKLSYKNFTLNFLIDFQVGGEFYSHGQMYRELMGTAEETLEGREEWYATHQGAGHLDPIPGVIPKGYVESGVTTTGEVNDVPVDPMLRNLQVVWFNRTVSDYILDASNVRLREASFVYTFPKRWFGNAPITNIDISLIGRNLFFFYNAAKHMDPESGYNSSTIGNAFELNAMPSSRSYGFSLNIIF